MLTVLNVAYPLAQAGPDAVGGAEQVLSALDRALVRSGHRSIVIACEGSNVSGILVPTPQPAGPLDDTAREKAQAAHRATIARVRDRWAVDVIHLHGVDFDAYLPDDGPTLVSLHLPLDWYRPQALRRSRDDLWLHTVSASQQRSAAPDLRLRPPIPNGIDIDSLSRGQYARRGFALLLSRICPEKGIHLALDAARMADMPLLIGGQVYRYTAHEHYFADEVVPRLDARRRFLGPLDLARKRRFLNAARCLVIPSLAAETSSLVAMEAIACGTPVVAFPNGALPDLIEDGKTGFLVRDKEEMAEAMQRTAAIDPDYCRSEARKRFPLRRMTEAYIDTYHALARLGKHSGR